MRQGSRIFQIYELYLQTVLSIPYHTIQYIIILEHQSKVGDPDTFDIKVKRVFKKCLDRQVMEGVMIGATELENRLNSRAEYLQPSVVRVGATRELEDSVQTRRRRTVGRRP